jgi:hypothetical protein
MHTTHIRVIINGDTLFADKEADFYKTGNSITKVPFSIGRNQESIQLDSYSATEKGIKDNQWFLYNIFELGFATKLIIDFRRQEVTYLRLGGTRKTEVMYYANRDSERAIN